jgi:hypothetical protein
MKGGIKMFEKTSQTISDKAKKILWVATHGELSLENQKMFTFFVMCDNSCFVLVDNYSFAKDLLEKIHLINELVDAGIIKDFIRKDKAFNLIEFTIFL